MFKYESHYLMAFNNILIYAGPGTFLISPFITCRTDFLFLLKLPFNLSCHYLNYFFLSNEGLDSIQTEQVNNYNTSIIAFIMFGCDFPYCNKI